MTITTTATSSTPVIKYPEAPTDTHTVDEYHTTEGHTHQVPDLFRPLEDPHSDETKAWVDQQVKLYEKYCDSRGLNPLQERILDKLVECNDYERVNCPSRRGGKHLFYWKNNGLQNQSVLYCAPYYGTSNGNGSAASQSLSEARVLLDPNVMSADGTVSIGATSIDKEARYLAYAVSRSGSDWREICVRDIATGEDLEDRLLYSKFSGMAWLADASGFFYGRYPEPKSLSKDDAGSDKLGSEVDKNEHQRLYFHHIGDSQESDTLVMDSDPEHPHWMYSAEVTDDDQYLVVYVSESTKPVNRLYYAKLVDSDTGKSVPPSALQIVKLIDNFDAEYSYLANDGPLFYFKTNLNAPRGKVISIDLVSGEKRDIIAETDEPLNDVLPVDVDKLVCIYMKDVYDTMSLHDLASGRLIRKIEMPAIGTVDSIHARREHSEIYYKFSSFTSPGEIYCHHVGTEETSVFYETRIGIDTSEIETRQVFYESKDGTRIPMFIVAHRDVELDGNNPTLLYGYGGFNISLQPYFSMKNILFVKYFKAVFAMANIRGGGEYGIEWHEQGIKSKKQNVFDDFISGAEYLVKNNYTSPSKLTIEGGSNGGLLVAACMLQRPDLFRTVICHVGVLDMLRFHLFTIGRAWTSDYGNSENPEDFEYLIKYSPLHNVRDDVEYPSIMVLTSDHDDRVVPLHSLKFLAMLQHKRPDNKNPLLGRIDVKAGHGAGLPLRKLLQKNAEIFAFMAHECGFDWVDDGKSN